MLNQNGVMPSVIPYYVAFRLITMVTIVSGWKMTDNFQNPMGCMELENTGRQVIVFSNASNFSNASYFPEKSNRFASSGHQETVYIWHYICIYKTTVMCLVMEISPLCAISVLRNDRQEGTKAWIKIHNKTNVSNVFFRHQCVLH